MDSTHKNLVGTQGNKKHIEQRVSDSVDISYIEFKAY